MNMNHENTKAQKDLIESVSPLPTSRLNDAGNIMIDMACPCELCEYNSIRMKAAGGHCYMFREKPRSCLQFVAHKE